ncbi:hypothetical protein CASFOL_037448 [Castilleja foliolosa]|uniref:Replication factor A C-terminal domain-containing protein n=1 Tax=Castilleja foliolosa TaxID=1961234 RepID=A0ABD3BMR4_9LAMI
MEKPHIWTEEDQQFFELFSQRQAKVDSLYYLKRMKEVSNCWVEACIVGIKTLSEYWYLACKKCTKKTYVQGSFKRCWHCREQIRTDTYRYKIEVTAVADNTTMTLLLWNRECEALVGFSAGVVNDLDANSGFGHLIVQCGLINRKFLFEVRGKANKDTNILDSYVISKVVLDPETIHMYRRLRQDRIPDQESTAGLHFDMKAKNFDNGRAQNVDDAEQEVDKEISNDLKSSWIGLGDDASYTSDDDDSIPCGSEDLTNGSMQSDAHLSRPKIVLDILRIY